MNNYKTGLLLSLALMTPGLSLAGNSGWMGSPRNWVKSAKDTVSGYFNPGCTQKAGELIKGHPYAAAVAAGAFAGYALYPIVERAAKNLAHDFMESKKSTQVLTVLGGLLAAYSIKLSGISFGSLSAVNPYIVAAGIAGFIGGNYLECKISNNRKK